MDLSVILATRNNAASLGRLLDRLTGCRTPAAWELIVVDNGGADDTVSVVRAYAERLPLRYVQEKRRGKSRALNRGLREASGAIILFTDDDVIPDPDWLVAHVEVMRRHPGVKAVGGRIIVDHAALPDWLVRSQNLLGMVCSEHDLGSRERPYPPGRYPYGPNLSVRREVLRDAAEPWPVNIGPGTPLPLGDEIVFMDAVTSPGPERLYAPSCRVRHVPRVEAGRWLHAVRRCFLGGYAAGRFARLPGVASPQPAVATAWRRLIGCRSWREFLCIGSRFAGHTAGRLSRHLRPLPRTAARAALMGEGR